MRAETEELRNFWAKMPDAIIATSAAGVIGYWHPAAERIYGYSSEAAVGRSLTELLVPLECVEAENHLRDEAIATGSAISESMRRLQNGAVIRVSVAKSAVQKQGGGLDCVLSVERNLSSAGVGAKSKAALQGPSRHDVLAGLRHEMRTPLNGLIGFAQLLQGEKAGPLNDKQKRFVALVLESGTELLRLVDDVHAVPELPLRKTDPHD